jgi:hypothetical protein
MAASFEPGVTQVWHVAGRHPLEALRLPGWTFQPLKGVGQERLDAGRLWQTGQVQLSRETKASVAGSSNRGQTPIGVIRECKRKLRPGRLMWDGCEAAPSPIFRWYEGNQRTGDPALGRLKSA